MSRCDSPASQNNNNNNINNNNNDDDNDDDDVDDGVLKLRRDPIRSTHTGLGYSSSSHRNPMNCSSDRRSLPSPPELDS